MHIYGKWPFLARIVAGLEMNFVQVWVGALQEKLGGDVQPTVQNPLPCL